MVLNLFVVYFLNLSIKDYNAKYIYIGTIIASFLIPIFRALDYKESKHVYYFWSTIISVYTIYLLRKVYAEIEVKARHL